MKNLYAKLVSHKTDVEFKEFQIQFLSDLREKNDKTDFSFQRASAADALLFLSDNVNLILWLERWREVKLSESADDSVLSMDAFGISLMKISV